MRYLFLSVFMAMIAISCSTTESKKESAVTITAVAAKSINLNNKQEFSFISKPYTSVNLSFRVGGPLVGKELLSGRYYKKGEVITQIDPRDFIIRKEKMCALYEQAKSEFERIEVLYNKNNISASGYEKTKAEYVNAKTAFQIACNELEDTKLIAPFNGYIGEVYVEKYQDVRSVQPVISFVDVDRLKIEAYIPQSVAVKCQDINNVRLKFDLISHESYTAKVLDVSKSTMSNNLSYLLTAEFNDIDKKKILAGMSGKINLDIQNETEQMVIAVPQISIAHRPSIGDYVWVINEQGVVEQRKVMLDNLLDGGMVIISQGLNEGEMVATSSLRFLSQGGKITLKR